MSNSNIITHLLGDATECMKTLPDNSVNLIIADPPYAVDKKKKYTANSWDKPIHWDQWFPEAWRIMKPNGALLLFGLPPLSLKLLTHPLAMKHYRYDWVWQKERGSNFQHANRQPLKTHEFIHVFYRKQPTYNPIKTDLDKVSVVKPYKRKTKTSGLTESSAAIWHPGGTYVGRFPTSIQEFPRDRPMVHGTQKPRLLYEYLIKTYTNPGDTVLDTFAGYATAGVAGIHLGDRNIIECELTNEWHEKGKNRLLQEALKLGFDTNNIVFELGLPKPDNGDTTSSHISIL